MTLIHSRSHWTQVLARFRNTWKRRNQGETQCWALLVISKATFAETAIKTKFVDRFFWNFFSTLIDQCTVKSPNFVSIELLKLSNMGAKVTKYCSDVIYLATFLLWDFLLSQVQHNIKFPYSKREFTTLGCPLKSTKVPFIWWKHVPGRRITRFSELPWASQLLLHYLTDNWRPFTRETKGKWLS